MVIRRLWVLGGVCVATAISAAACGDEKLAPLPQADGGATVGGGGAGGAMGGMGGSATPPPREGALIELEMAGEVAVLLDEVPEAMRDDVAGHFIVQSEDAWRARVHRQITITDIYNAYIPGILPLPPPETWRVTFAPGPPERGVRDGHDVVVRAYTFEAMLFSDPDTPDSFELGAPGDEHVENIWLPLDPDLLYQRIGTQCVDSSGFSLPYFQCPGVVQQIVGTQPTWRRYTRLKYDPDVAAAARVGEVRNPYGADLDVAVEGLEDHIIRYRYFAPDSCAIEEACVGAPGWRRLLEFTATVVNRGSEAMHIGNVLTGPWLQHNTFFYSPCHQHLHFLFYGDYHLGPLAGDKRAFCLISTTRYHNNEHTPLRTPYTGTCVTQGIAAGWGDDYFIGLDCQWIDITDMAPGRYPLTFASNPERFLCEGKPVLASDGGPVFEPTEFVTEGGAPIDRPACTFMDGWDDNNSETVMVDIPATGGYQNEPCALDLIGPRRNCGFSISDSARTCTPGATVELTCSVADPELPMVVRVCEDSVALGATLPCTESQSRVTTVVSDNQTVSFTCPEARDDSEPGGSYSIMVAPLLSYGAAQPVSCAP